jgi:hypothetical protein
MDMIPLPEWSPDLLLNALAGADAALRSRTNSKTYFALLLAYTLVEAGGSIIRTIGT